ncbi:hypothetical protein GF342_01980 [Candidatus Woesearchaeota archaeon]|nr:hypothetical protein [Candidatus Woesearchaeota archaeon]
MKKFISFMIILLLLLSLAYAETSSSTGGGGSSAMPSSGGSGGGGGSSAPLSSSGGGGSGSSSSGGTSCQEYYTCPDGSQVEYCKIVENRDDSGNLVGAGCACKSSPSSQCSTTTPASSGGSGGGKGGISPISGGAKDKYEFYDKIGGDDEGSSNYQFNQPNDIAVDSSGNIYVIDMYNDRIMIYNSDLEFVEELDANFNEPRIIAIDKNDNIYVADKRDSWGRLRKFDKDGNVLLALQEPGMPQEFAEENDLVGILNIHADGIAVNSKGDIYVADGKAGRDEPERNRILIFDSDGDFDQEFTDSEFYRPSTMAFDDNDYLYLNDHMDDRIVVYDDDLDYVEAIENQGFHRPSDIEFDSDGYFYVVDKFNQRVEVYDEDLEYYATIAGNGAGNDNDQLYFPNGIDIDDGKVFLVNHKNHRLSIFQKKSDEDNQESDPIETEPDCPDDCEWNGEVCLCKEELICDGCKLNDKCYFKGTRLKIDSKENFCNNNNEWSLQKADSLECQNAYECQSNICEKNQCGKYCEGCKASNGCFPFGTRFESGKYCDIDKSIKEQKSKEMSCSNDYECSTNVCVNNKCISSNLLQKVINWFKNLFS